MSESKQNQSIWLKMYTYAKKMCMLIVLLLLPCKKTDSVHDRYLFFFFCQKKRFPQLHPSLLPMLSLLLLVSWISMTFKRFLRLCSPSALYRPPRTLINMGTPYPRTPWVTPSRRVSTPPLWTSRNPNLLVGVNLDIGSAVNKELHIKVIFKDQIGSNLSKLAQSCPNLSRLVKTCLNLLVRANLDIGSKELIKDQIG